MSLGNASPSDYQKQLDKKIQITSDEFACFSPPKLEVHPSPPANFRMRAEFKIWHENESCHYAMYQPGEYKKPVKIDTFSIGSDTICKLMPLLLERLNLSPQLKTKLFQVEFLTATTHDAVITLIYHKPLSDAWETEAKILANQLNISIIGRSRKQKRVIGQDFIFERFKLNVGEFAYQQVETGFTQPNGFVCQDMLNWATDCADHLSEDLLELYCGNGNFTLPLSRKFNRVLATEVSKTSVTSANFNIQNNGINNITVVRLSSEEFTQATQKVREFRRLKDIALEDYQFSTVFVDPPRAGLDADTEAMISQYDNIIYISCNPDTLHKNLQRLTQSHDIKRFALFDQFPYTHHRECGVLLSKK